MSNGYEGLKNISKKFVKTLSDLAYTYFREKKFAIKRKQKKLMIKKKKMYQLYLY